MRVNRLYPIVMICVTFVVLMLAFPVNAWGPRSVHGITRTAIHVLPPDAGRVLREYQEEVLAGANLSERELIERFPHYGFEDPVLTVVSEMELLRAAKARGVSPYFAYRMGVLGKLVADMNQPFFTVPGAQPGSRLKQQYEAEADAAAAGIPYESSKRRYVVDVGVYFEQSRTYLKDAEALITSDYDNGVGFKGYAKRSLNVYFTNSVNAVADIWYTVFEEAGLPSQAVIRPVSLRDYYVDAVGFYLQRDDDERAGGTYSLLESAGMLDTDSIKEVADKYYQNDRHERAISLYRTVLEREPRRADVRKTISDYFFNTGLALLEQKRYEEAERAFDEVLKNDLSRADARQRKLETARLMAERDKRLALTMETVEEARQAAQSAERARAQRKFAEAVALYRQAREAYGKVSGEFEDAYAEASQKSEEIEAKIARLIGDLVNDVAALQPVAVREQAREAMRSSSERGIRIFVTRLIQDEHIDKAESLSSQLLEEERRALQP